MLTVLILCTVYVLCVVLNYGIIFASLQRKRMSYLIRGNETNLQHFLLAVFASLLGPAVIVQFTICMAENTGIKFLFGEKFPKNIFESFMGRSQKWSKTFDSLNSKTEQSRKGLRGSSNLYIDLWEERT